MKDAVSVSHLSPNAKPSLRLSPYKSSRTTRHIEKPKEWTKLPKIHPKNETLLPDKNNMKVSQCTQTNSPLNGSFELSENELLSLREDVGNELPFKVFSHAVPRKVQGVWLKSNTKTKTHKKPWDYCQVVFNVAAKKRAKRPANIGTLIKRIAVKDKVPEHNRAKLYIQPSLRRILKVKPAELSVEQFMAIGDRCINTEYGF